MPITIECPHCHTSYPVGDQLAGQTIDCKSCGHAILVTTGVTDLQTRLLEYELEPEPRSASSSNASDDTAMAMEPPPEDDEPPAEPAAITTPANECLSCGAALLPRLDLCGACGFNRKTGKKQAASTPKYAAADVAAIVPLARPPGDPYFVRLDAIIGAIALLLLMTGLTVASVHLGNSAAGFSLPAIEPIGMVLVIIAAIFAPLVVLSINSTLRALQQIPREDAYVRVLLILLFPFSVSLMFGWPGIVDRWGTLITLAWVITPLLLIYLFRGDLQECFTSFIVGGLAIGIGFLAMVIVAPQLPVLTKHFYQDMLPTGPWTSIASGRSPESLAALNVTTAPKNSAPDTGNLVGKAPTVAETNPENADAALTPMPLPPDVVTTAPALLFPNDTAATESTAVAPPALPATLPAPMTPGEPITPTAPLVPPHPPVATATPPANSPPIPPVSPVTPPVEPSFITSVEQDAPLFRDVSRIFSSPTVEDMLFTVRDTDTETMVEGWSLSQRRKIEQYGYPLYVIRPPVFALSPRADFMVAMVFFPKTQIEINSLAKQNRPARKIIQFNVPNAVPHFMGFYDMIHFCIRWELGNRAILQTFNAASGMEVRHTNIDAPIGEPNSTVFSLNQAGGGPHLMAQFTTGNRIALYGLDPDHRIGDVQTSDLNVRLFAMAFSPDASQIAMYAVVSNLRTIINYSVRSGDVLSTTVLSPNPYSDNGPGGVAHTLTWLPDGKAWLIDGNELFSATSGKRIGSLNIIGASDEQLIPPDQLALVLRGINGGTSLGLAKINTAKIREADEAIKMRN